MDNNKNRMKDRPKSKNELRKIDPTGNSEVGIENGERIGLMLIIKKAIKLMSGCKINNNKEL